MKTLGKSALLSVILTVVIVALLNADKLTQVKKDVKTLEVAAGKITTADPTSPDPQVHCYAVKSPDQLDIRTRMDFEARTSGGWIPSDPDANGNYCLKESEHAVAKRLAAPPAM